MKKFLIGILTILITFSFIILGIAFHLKTTIVDTFESLVKEEITDEIAFEVAKYTSAEKEKIKEELTKVMEKDAILKRVIENGLDKAVNILNGKEVSTLDFTKDLETIVDNSEEILEEYGITITEEEKKELLRAMDNEKINQEFQVTIKEVQANVPQDVKFALDAFGLFRSTTFRVILISSILFFLLCIAFLKKSYYKWLGNLSESTIVCGIFYGFCVSSLVNLFNKELANTGNFTLVATSLIQYGYILIGIGFLALILKLVIAKMINSKEKNANE